MQQLDLVVANAQQLCVELEREGAPPLLDACREGRAIAGILAEWGADELLQAAALLHRALWINAVTPERVAEACHPQVAQLCEDFVWLFLPGGERDPLPVAGEVSVTGEELLVEDDPAAQAAMLAMPAHWQGRRLTYRRIRAYCLAYRDPDLALLQAAVLWRRFERAAAGERELLPFGDEASLLLGPYLEMLGMRQLRARLSDWVGGRIGDGRGREERKRTPLMDAVVAHLTPLLASACLNTQNTQAHAFDASNTAYIADGSPQVPTVEILVAEEEDCYQALFQVHRLFMPVENALTDNIGAGRINGYRGISTSVMVPVNLADLPVDAGVAAVKEASRRELRRMRIDVRIATGTMDAVNRWGLAALTARPPGDMPPLGWWLTAESGFRQILTAPLGSLPDTLYVFSPHGQLFRFKRGCTVIDYAYHVHSELADRCSQFYVNGLPAEPGRVLHHLDLVELEHDALAPGPTQAWLDAAQTKRARSKIEKHLKRMGQDVYLGRRIVEQRRRALEEHYGFSMPEAQVEQAIQQSMRRQKLHRIEDLYGDIAAGRWSVDRMLHGYFAAEMRRQVRAPSKLRLRSQQFQMAQCCMPRPGEDIVGRPIRRRGVVTGLKVHRLDCSRIGAPGGRLAETISLKWELQPRHNALARIEMNALNDDGLLGAALDAIYVHVPAVQLHRVEAATRRGIATLRFTLEAEGVDLLEAIVSALRFLPGRNVDSVHAMSLPPSEEDEILSRSGIGPVNPYSRLPVNESEMFFGRAREISRVVDWLQSGAGSVWLRGQKRVGKTSLLLHLKRYRLEDHGCVPVFIDCQLLSTMAPERIFFEVASNIYTELTQDTGRGDLRQGEWGAPIRELFQHDPQGQFIAYLQNLQSKLGKRRLVLLLDEFSRTIDAFNQSQLDESFFYQWRGVMLATMPEISYVTVVQQKSYDMMSIQRAQSDIDPIWELLELGEQLALRQLSQDDVRRLIEWPIRNYLEYSQETVDIVARLTGGSPFFIQSFCFKLVSHMSQSERRQVTWEDVEQVLQEFLDPNESLFSHLLDLVHGIGHPVMRTLAWRSGDNLNSVVPTDTIVSDLPDIDREIVVATLLELAAHDIIVYTTTNDEEGWSFANLLFQQWLLTNSFLDRRSADGRDAG